MRRRVTAAIALLVAFGAGLLVGVVPTPAASSDGRPGMVTVRLGPCLHEDGNPDGTPCFWTDPDTGQRFVVDSSEYYDNLLEAGKQLPTLAS